MVRPRGRAGGVWLAVDAAQRDAIGSSDGARAGDFARLDDGAEFVCATVDGPDASTWTPAAGGGGLSLLNLSPIPLDGNVVGAWRFEWDATTESFDLSDRSANANDLIAVDVETVAKVGNLDGALILANDGFRTPGHPSALYLQGDMTIEILHAWDGAGNSEAIWLGLFTPGEGSGDNAQYLIRNNTGGIGLQWFTESGSGVDDLVDFGQIELTGQPSLLTFTRSGNLITVYIDGLKAAEGTQSTAPTGGGTAEFRIADNDTLTDCYLAGVSISNIARSAADVLARAQAVGVAA